MAKIQLDISEQKLRKLVSVGRVFRILRPIRTIRMINHVDIVVTVVTESLGIFGTVCMLLLFLLAIFSLIGTSSFGGTLQFECVPSEFELTGAGSTLSVCSPGQTASALDNDEVCPMLCPSQLACAENFKWCARLAEPRTVGSDKNGLRNYDNFHNALVTVFVQTSGDGGLHTMPQALFEAGAKAKNVGWFVSFFISVLLNLVTLNLFLAVCCSAYSDVASTAKEMEDKQRLLEDKIHAEELRVETEEEAAIRLQLEAEDEASHASYSEKLRLKHWSGHCCGGLRDVIKRLVLSEMFESATSLIIVGNTVTMAMAHTDMDPVMAQILMTFEIIFLVVYCIEASLKLTAAGSSLYFFNSMNQFDLFVILASLIGFVATFFAMELEDAVGFELSSMQSFRAVRLLRALQIVRLLHRQKALIMVMKTIFKAWKPLLWHSLFCLFSMSVFAIIGMHMFGGSLGPVSRHGLQLLQPSLWRIPPANPCRSCKLTRGRLGASVKRTPPSRTTRGTCRSTTRPSRWPSARASR